RYYFMKECPFPGDGEFTWQRFTDLYNADLANNLGNLYSRVTTLLSKNYATTLSDTAGKPAPQVEPSEQLKETVEQIRAHIDACPYNQALDGLILKVASPANKFADQNEPWKVVKVDKEKPKPIIGAMAEHLRKIAILLKPFLPRTAETIYTSFNFA